MEIGRIRKRPAGLKIPSFVLKMIYGQLAEETIMASQQILPEALLDAGYSFQFPDIKDALRNILGNKQGL